MASVLQIATPDAVRRIQRVQTVTIAWMSVEAVVSLFAAWRARSPALLAFGGDSTIELFSAVVVLWRFRATAAHEEVERRAARVAGALLFTLAAYVAVTSVASLLGYSEPKPTLLGIAILVAAAAVMPWLAKEKRRLSGVTGSAALRADAAQSVLCAYLSLIALAGLAINAIGTQSGQTRLLPWWLCLSSFGRDEKPCGGNLAAVARLVPERAPSIRRYNIRDGSCVKESLCIGVVPHWLMCFCPQAV